MRTLTQYILRIADLAEAEGRVAKRAAFRLTAALCVLVCAAAVLLGSLALFIAAGYVALTFILPAPLALVIVAGGLLLIGVGFLFTAMTLRK